MGSGKSILLQILQKFQNFEEGEVFVNKTIPFKEIAPTIWRETIGVVPQEIKIFNSTLIENIVLGDILNEGEKAIEFCQKLGFGKYLDHLPQSYLTIVGEEGINLSGGQKQLVALARALYRKPNLLLLDEATSAMDSKTEQFVLDLLEKLKPNLAILMVTHRQSIAQKADNIYALENGFAQEITIYTEL